MKNNRVLTTAHSFVWRIQSPRLSNTQRLLVILFLHPTPQAKRGLLALIKSSFTLWQYYCTRAHHQLSFLAPVYLRCYCDVTGNPSSSISSTFSNSYRVQGRKDSQYFIKSLTFWALELYTTRRTGRRANPILSFHSGRVESIAEIYSAHLPVCPLSSAHLFH